MEPSRALVTGGRADGSASLSCYHHRL